MGSEHFYAALNQIVVCLNVSVATQNTTRFVNRCTLLSLEPITVTKWWFSLK